VYGATASSAVSETDPTVPVNPYGETKLVGEWLVRDAAKAWGLRGVALRYFNVAGAGWPELGDPVVMNLVTMVLDRLARGQQPLVFGDDYATPDGTCVRDFVHVLDLASAHIGALDYLDRDERPFDVLNVGTGRGASVREVVELIGAVSGRDTTPEVVARRAGDPASVVASVDRITQTWGWRAQAGLREVVESAWTAWQAGPRAM
jgi:UDP-glucose 4-epimerase